MEILIFLLIAGLFFSIRAIVLRRHTGCGVIAFIGIILIISAPFIYLFWPFLEFDKSRYGNPVLVASRKSVASCSSNLYLYENGKFRYFTICFGHKSTTGEYQIVGDSISFVNPSDDFFKYAIYNRDEKYLLFYRNESDSFHSESDTISSLKIPMPIIRDELK